jgi:DNA/RNA endonuclease G (NUC1)
MTSAWIKLKSFLILGLLLCTASCLEVVSQPLVLVRHDAFVSYYDCSVLNPACVVWVLTPEAFQGNLKPTTRHFKTDTQLPTPRVKDSDLRGTGYVRGHLCPAGDRDSDKGLLKQTYLTSNLSPMTMVCNSGPWKAVEDSCRALAVSHGRLLIAAGIIPEYCDTIFSGHKKIFVPCRFWKMAKCLNHPGEVWIWIVQNSPSWSAPVRISRNELELVLPTPVRNTGILDNLFSLGLN